MKARILFIATLATVSAGVLPAVDPHLLGLVMPDAKVLAGVNVVSAKNSPFGQYVLAQIAPNQELQRMAALTGFDPTQDLIEILAASNGVPGSHTGLALATGTFNTSAILAAATMAGATSETYNGANVIEDPNAKNGPGGIAFLGSTIAIAGDLADVKAAIDRQSNPSKIDSGLSSQANLLSAGEDAWAVSIIGPPALAVQAPSKGTGGGSGTVLPATALQEIVSGNAGVKFGTNVVVTAQAQADNAQDATTLAGMIQLLANMAKLQADKNPAAASLANGLTISSSGVNINISFTVPQSQLQQLMAQPHAAPRAGRGLHKK